MAEGEAIVVFDAYTFFRGVSQDTDQWPDECDALEALKRHSPPKLLVTEAILDEYENVKRHFPLSPYLDALRDLEAGRKVSKRRPRKRPNQSDIPGLPKEHSEIITEAVAGEASYVLSKWNRWHGNRPLLAYLNDEGVEIVYPLGYCQILEQG